MIWTAILEPGWIWTRVSIVGTQCGLSPEKKVHCRWVSNVDRHFLASLIDDSNVFLRRISKCHEPVSEEAIAGVGLTEEVYRTSTIIDVLDITLVLSGGVRKSKYSRARIRC